MAKSRTELYLAKYTLRKCQIKMQWKHSVLQ